MKNLSLITVYSITLAGGLLVHGQDSLTNGLVAYYTFDGGSLKDASGSGANATLVGSSVSFAPDRFNKTSSACQLTNSSFVDIGPLFPLQTPNQLTEACWVKSSQVLRLAGDGVGTLRRVVLLTGRTSYETNVHLLFGGSGSLCVNENGFLSFAIDDDNYLHHCQATQVPASAVFDGRWHHVVGVKDGSQYALYFDGSLAASLADSHTLSASASARHFWVGRHVWDYIIPLEADGYDGDVDEVRIYTRPLSAAEVQQLYRYEYPAASLEIGVSQVRVVEHLLVGKSYVVESSFDLQSWTPVGTVFTAQTNVMVKEYDVSLTGRFFRLVQLP